MKKSDIYHLRSIMNENESYCDLAIACLQLGGAKSLFFSELKNEKEIENDSLKQAFVFLKQSEFRRRYAG